MLIQVPESSAKMNNRSGLPVKNIVTAIFILLSVYLLYIYNVAQNRLHDAEMTGARYRREAEEKVTEIQGLVAAKDDFQERCEGEKRELKNRLQSINQKHSMLQSQNTEIEADFMKLKQDMENLRTEHMQTESQHAQEYQTLKQSKEKELQDLTDQFTNMKNQNDELQNTINSLRAQIQSDEASKKNLLDQNAQLQLLQFQQQKQLQLQQQNEQNAKKAQELQQKQMNVVSENKVQDQGAQDLGGLVGNHIVAGNQNVDVMSQDNKSPQDLNADHGAGLDPNQGAKIDQLNAMNQAKPPNLNAGLNDENDEVDEQEKDDKDEDNDRPEVNPNDLQRKQIQEPLKEDGGEVDGLGHMNIRAEEERRELEEKDDEAPEHKNPLDLGQMEQPLGMNGHLGGVNEQDKVGQQQPPVIAGQNNNGMPADENEQNKAVNPVAPL